MSGRRINDHSSWVGKGGKDSVFPAGNKVKHEFSAEGSAHLGAEYPDTTEDIKRDQDHSASKVKSHKIKPGYRH